MDIASLRAADTFAMPVKGPAGQTVVAADGSPVEVVVYGPGSRAFIAAQQAQTERMVARVRAAGGKAPAPTVDEQLAETATFLADCTAAFNRFSYEGGADRAAFIACYADPGMGWLTRQVDTAIGDWRNFTPASPTA
jgi:hypothetical protein